MNVNGIPVGKKLDQYYLRDDVLNQADGSCMIVVITDAPLSARNLKRIAKRAVMGLARTGGIASNGSGDYVIAVSTAEEVRIPYLPKNRERKVIEVHNDHMSPLFMATIEATEEAILNSLFMAETITGYKGRTIKALPIKKIQQWLGE